MKTHIFILCSLFLLHSCSLEEVNNQFTKEERFEIIKNDPIVSELFVSIEKIAKLTAESETLDAGKYAEIVKSNNIKPCECNKSIFNGDVEMEQLVDLHCQMRLAKKAFRDKYPMSSEERSEFILTVNRQINYDMEVMREKAKKKHLKEIGQD